MLRLLLLVGLLVISRHSLTQSKFDSIRISYDTNDTANLVRLLNEYIDSNRTDYTAVLATIGLIRIHQARRDTARWMQVLDRGIQLKPRSFSNTWYFTNTSLWRDPGSWINSQVRDLSLEQSDLHHAFVDKECALYYLQVAEQTKSGTGCANEMIQFMTKMGMRYANFYLKEGDTAAALKRLTSSLTYFEGRSSIESALMLRKLLLIRYSLDEIRAEVKRAVSTSKIVRFRSRHTGHCILFGNPFDMYLFSKKDARKGTYRLETLLALTGQFVDPLCRYLLFAGLPT